jgi:hypothetical protein
MWRAEGRRPCCAAFTRVLPRRTIPGFATVRLQATAVITGQCNMRPIEVFPLATFSSPTSPTPTPSPREMRVAGWPLSPWDLRAGSRGAALTLALAALAVLMTALTDEGGVSISERCARVLPVLPVCAAVGAWLALAGPKRRIEVRALEALGRRPVDSAIAAALGAALVGVASALVMAVDAQVDVSGFFPTLHAAGPYSFDAGVFTNRGAGWSVLADGSVVLPTSATAGALGRAVPAHARESAALVVATGSLAFALLVAVAGRTRQRHAALALFATMLVSVVLFQAAAASRIPPLATPIPSTLLLMAVGWAILRAPKEGSS